ncbi:IPTL-CTERM sorting domain-containing protein [Comamonas odontotermitis]|uniref:IPTL-CTERM sorting domain-containing protein n=1 Tax=Comamonas odontotermitis TaxID=379895 RepID=UPI003752DED4
MAFAQKVLMLTTNETATDATLANNNLQSEFQSVVGAANFTRMDVLSNANTISQATFTSAPGPYDIVIVASTYNPVDSTNWAVIQNAVANRWANSIVFFVDGCCEATNGNNAGRMVAALNGGALTNFSLGASLNAFASFPLNTNSPFAPSFAGLNPFVGGYITYINQVPASNALYLATGTSPVDFPAAGSTPVNNVYGLLIPTAQSNAGKGACVFSVVDISPFGEPAWTANRGKVAPAFVNAATSENGACGLPKVAKSFDKADIYLGGADNTATLTIQLSNGTPVAISGVNLTDNLPQPLQIATSAATHTCTGGTLTAAQGTSAVSLTGFGIPSGGCSVTVPVVWPNSDAGRQTCVNTPAVTNTITPGTDFVSPTGQVNTPASASLTCHAGMLNLSKLVVWPANVPPVDLTGTSFPVTVACTGTDGVVLPPINTSIVLSSATQGTVATTPVISSGSCTVTETSRSTAPANYIWVENPLPSATASLVAPPAAASATLTNTLARANSDITVNKTVSGGPATGVSGIFKFTANCGADGTFQTAVTLSGASTGAIAITNVPQGASCTISEDAALPAAPAGYAWSTDLPPAVTLVTSGSGNVAAFVNKLTSTAPSTPAPVPTLKEWGLMALSLVLVAMGVVQLRRRQS